MKKDKKMIILFILPAIIAYSIVFLYPTIRTTIMSFFHMQYVTEPVKNWKFVGFGNYSRLFNSTLFMTSLKNLGGIWLYGGIINFFFAVFFSVVLTSGVKRKSFFRAVIYLPNVISAVAMGTMWLQYVLNAKYGLFHNIFEFLHIGVLASRQWTGPDHIFSSLIIAFSFGSVGYFVLIFMAAIEKIPHDFYEAAMLEGASVTHQFTHITFPLLKDTFANSLVLWTVQIVAFFVWSQVFSPLTPEPGTVTPMVYMYQEVFGSNTVVTERFVGAGAAVGVILSIIVVIAFLLSNIIFKSERLEY